MAQEACKKLEYPSFEFIGKDKNDDTLVITADYPFSFEGRAEVVKEGFRCDGVSTPAFLWVSVSPKVDYRSIVAGVTHDWIYRMQPDGWSRRDADRMFYGYCREYGLGWWKSVKAYIGLRLFGGKAWRDNARKTCPGCRMDCGKCYRYEGNRKGCGKG